MPAMTNSKTVVLAVVLSLALAALAVIVGAVVLGAGGHVVPGELWTLAGTAIGAIAGLLAKTSTEPTVLQAATLEQTAIAVDGTTVAAPKQPAKVAHARATRTAPPATS